MMHAGLQLRQGQQLTVTPQLQQAIRLLQLSSMELEGELREALESNVFLEQDETAGMGAETPVSADLPVSGASSSLSRPEEHEAREQAAPGETLSEHLHWQLDMCEISDRDRMIAAVIIDALNPNGYLGESRADLLEVLSEEQVSRDELEAVRARVMHLDPVGCGAVGLQECLLTQLSVLDPGLSHGCRGLAERLIGEDLALLAEADLNLLAERLGCEPEGVAAALDLLRSLHPNPGSLLAPSDTAYIVPDVLVSRREGRWVVELNPELLPKVRVNRTYESMMGQGGAASGHAAMQTQLQEARWLVKSLQMRNETLLKVAGAIVRHQRGFLDHGEIAMRPMVLSDIAEAVEMHESTVSRVTTQKYIHTPRGNFELKYFFSSRLATKGGGRCSSTAVRALTRTIVDSENPSHPLSDSEIARLLAEKGVRIARRTVAKYRDSLGIPPLAERQAAAARHGGRQVA
ncbi:MAG: RNA polymerase factor sigma-54 [Wenzhouxiangella sp.]|jgi:RNA polymerase sigma-54 factor|nr:RNA polymerase factor sigma-54 [Wenzhouxiangella sp.]